MKTNYVNHLERKKIENIEYWFWEDKIGSQCGRERKWKYKVEIGDTYSEKGVCPEGFKYYEIKYSGKPEQI